VKPYTRDSKMGDVRDFNQNPTSPDGSEDGSGLELSLRLSCGGSTSKVKGKEPNSNEGKEKLKNGKTGVKNAFLNHFLQNCNGGRKILGNKRLVLCLYNRKTLG
jgi:hypothetical protein